MTLFVPSSRGTAQTGGAHEAWRRRAIRGPAADRRGKPRPAQIRRGNARPHGLGNGRGWRAPGPFLGLLAGWEALRQRNLGASAAGHVFRALATEIRIETKRRRLVETDGSVFGTMPISVSIRPAALTVIEPRP
jgi:hypothetical protein